MSVVSKIPFSELAGLLEKISKKQGHENKRLLFKTFVEQWRQVYKELHKDDATTEDNFHPIMRLMLPHLERERVAYGIKEHMLARLYIEVLGLGKDSADAQKLVNYRNPKNNKDTSGDFAMIAYFILVNRCPEKGTLSIEEVNEKLDNIATGNANKNKEQVKKNILYLLRNLSALEQKWLIRMILKELKIGMSHKSILNTYHPDAEELFDVNASLLKVCAQLKDPSVRMHEIEITMFSSFRPMLGESAAPHEVEKIMNGQPYFIETKFDGERMQLHKNGDEYKYFSRQSHDFSSSFGATKYKGTFTPAIHSSFKSHVKTIILDGEMIGIDTETGIIRTKGENIDIKSTSLSGIQPCYCVFDILLLNDKVLSNVPLRKRKEILKTIFEPIEDRIIISEVKEARTKAECVDALNEAINNREEGIMVKNAESIYKPNTRKGGWWKIKPEYVKGLMDELDVLVVGGNFGSGGRASNISHFVCAVAVPPTSGDRPTKFHSFCRVGSGYTREELARFNIKLAPYWKQYNKKNPPTKVSFVGGSKERPEVWIEPENSIIIQIKATEIIPSDQFMTGCTLRFPRLEMFRDDKPWYDCMTTTMLEDLRQKSEGKLTGRLVELDDEELPAKKKRKVVSIRQKPTLGTQFRATDTATIEQVSQLFKDKEFCVINGSNDDTKSEIEAKIVEYGGTFVQHPGSETFCVLCDKVVYRVRNLMSRDLYDIAKLNWLLLCIQQQRLIPWRPSDLHHMSEATQKKFKSQYDEFGDSYTEDISREQLADILDNVKDLQEVSQEEIAEFENEFYPDESPDGLFRIYKFYVDMYSDIGNIDTQIKNSPLELSILDLQCYGGNMVTELTSDVSHLVVSSWELSRVNTFRNILSKRKKKFHIVNSDWISECIDRCLVVNERQFEPSND